MHQKKYILAISILICGNIGFTFALPDFSTTIFPRLHQQGLTRYDMERDFRGDDSITRGEAAKFFATYAQVANLPRMHEETSETCTFEDIATYDRTLVPYIMKACAFGLMKGSDGKFMPNDTLTQAQAITVVVRTLEGYLDESGTPRYSPYVSSAVDLGMFTTETVESVDNMPASRAKLGTWLYIADKRAHEQLLFTKPSMLASNQCVWEEISLPSENARLLVQNCVFEAGNKISFETDETLPGFVEINYDTNGKKHSTTKRIEFINTQGTTTSGPVEWLENWLDKTFATIDTRNPDIDVTLLSPDMAAQAKTDQKLFVDKLKANGVLGECNLQKIKTETPANIERYQYVPTLEYKSKIQAVSSLVGPVIEPCGPYGISNGQQFFQIDHRYPQTPVFVRMGQDMVFFDINSLTLD